MEDLQKVGENMGIPFLLQDVPCGDLLQGDSVTGIRLAGRFRAGRMRGADKGGMREVQMM